MTRLAGLLYVLAAIALPLVGFFAQPHACFWHLYLPYIVPWFALLSLGLAAAQPVSRVTPRVKVVTACVFGLSVQASMLVPCVSAVDSSWILQLAKVVLILGWLCAAAVTVSVIALLHAGAHLTTRCLISLGLALAATSLAAGSTLQFVGITGAQVALPEWLLEAPLVQVLQAGTMITMLALLILLVQQRVASSPGSV